MTGGDGHLFGERLPLWIPLTMAFAGLLSALLASQIAVADTDDPSADQAAESSPTGSSPTVQSAPSDATSGDDPDDRDPDDEPSSTTPATSIPTTSAAPNATTSTTAADLDCPPVFEVFFAVGSAQPLSDGGTKPEELASWMDRNGEAQLLLDGHADAAGSEQANLELSFRRAEAAAALLAEAGIAPGRLQPRGFGEYQPVPGVAPDSEQNRRVTMEVADLVGCPANDDKDVTE